MSTPQEQADRRDELRRSQGSFWKSRTLRVMVLITVIGTAMWAYALATAAPVPATHHDPSLVAGLTSNSASTTAAAAPRLIDEAAPATFRFGLSFVVGFFLAWIFRRVLKVIILAAGAITVLFLILRHFGVVNLNFDALEGEVTHGVDVAREKATEFKSVILGYLPSGASATAGLVVGAKRAR